MDLIMNQPWSQDPLERMFCGIMKCSHFLNYLKLNFLLHAAKSTTMIEKLLVRI